MGNRLLFDTHALLWWSLNDVRLPAAIRLIISSSNSTFFVSVISLWEIRIKVSTGKLTDPPRLLDRLAQYNFEILPVDAHHVERLKDLPLHHRDPFDRMLIAQSLAEELTLISNEAMFDAYGVQRVW